MLTKNAVSFQQPGSDLYFLEPFGGEKKKNDIVAIFSIVAEFHKTDLGNLWSF